MALFGGLPQLEVDRAMVQGKRGGIVQPHRLQRLVPQLAHADPRMVAVAMGDHRARHRPPRIDMEIAGRAIQAFGAQDDKI